MAAPPPTACARVWAVVELAEQILLDLPFTQLLKIQRVNKYFNQILCDSTPLQQKLHLRPKQGPEPYAVIPVLPKHMSYNQPWTAILQIHKQHQPQTTSRINHLHTPNPTPTSAPTWENFLLTQPPHQTIALNDPCCDPHGEYDGESFLDATEVSNATGSTLGDINRAAQQLLKDHETGECLRYARQRHPSEPLPPLVVVCEDTEGHLSKLVSSYVFCEDPEGHLSKRVSSYNEEVTRRHRMARLGGTKTGSVLVRSARRMLCW